jgi:mRNA-degrading endonuclease RelE of RelBE toxin-antitoxin system
MWWRPELFRIARHAASTQDWRHFMNVYYTDTAKQQLKELERHFQKRILDKVAVYASLPNPLEFAEPLAGYDMNRFRVGDYRVAITHGLRRRRAGPMPLQTSGDHPSQNSRPLLLELFRKLWVAISGRDRHIEGDEVEPPTNCLIYRSQVRFVVARDKELELWLILEKVLAHEARGYFVSACDGFQFRLCPCPAFLCLDRRYKPGAHETGQVGGMARDHCRPVEA